MKKIKLLQFVMMQLFVVMASCFTACSSDDDTKQPVTNDYYIDVDVSGGGWNNSQADDFKALLESQLLNYSDSLNVGDDIVGMFDKIVFELEVFVKSHQLDVVETLYLRFDLKKRKDSTVVKSKTLCVEPATQNKKLVEIKTIWYESDFTAVKRFEYDEKGNLVSAYCNDLGSVYTYDWEEDGVQIYRDGVLEGYYTISGGKIIKSEGNRLYNMQYDDAGRLKSCKFSYPSEYIERYYSCVWDSGKLERIDVSDVDSSDSWYVGFLCSGDSCKGFFPLMGKYIGNDLLAYAAPWLFGVEQQYLPSRISEENECEIIQFTHFLDEDGYVNKCICRNVYDDIDTVWEYQFVWK